MVLLQGDLECLKRAIPTYLSLLYEDLGSSKIRIQKFAILFGHFPTFSVHRMPTVGQVRWSIFESGMPSWVVWVIVSKQTVKK